MIAVVGATVPSPIPADPTRAVIDHPVYGAIPVISGHTGDPLGELLEWQGGERFLPMTGAAVLVTDGALLWQPLSGGIWVAHAYSRTCDPLVRRGSRALGRVARSFYLTALREHANRSAGLAAPPMAGLEPGQPVVESAAARLTSAHGVRFSRS